MDPGKLAELRQMLAAHFSKSELETLCFDLGLDYENLPADTKDALAREMVRSLNRKQRLDQLVARCREERPQVSWPDIPAHIPTDTTTSFLSREGLARAWRGSDRVIDGGKRQILLEKVRKFWVDGVLARTMKERALLDLSWRRETRFVDHPWDELGEGVYEADTESDTILDAFEDADEGMLILGDPGSGKTILLLQLAQKLVERAEKDPTEPVPVVLNLVSWDGTHRSLGDWVVDELAAKYHIPRNIGREWFEADALLLLLDGMDEVEYVHQKGCVEAINDFRQAQGLTGVVVSCRTGPYEAIGLRLKFGGAIRLAPLTEAQISYFLDHQPGGHRQLKQALKLDDEMREMARSPLLLGLMDTVYRDDEDLTESGLQSRVQSGTFRQRLFTDYARQMMQSRGQEIDTDEVTQQLTLLAQKLNEHSQNIFLIDQLQPSWLPGRGWRWAYLLLTRITTALVIGLGSWLAYIVINRYEEDFSLAPVELFVERLSLPPVWSVLVFEMLVHFGLGLAIGLVDIALFEYWEKRPFHSDKWRRVIHLILIIMTVDICILAVILPLDTLVNALISMLIEGLTFFLVYSLVHGDGYRQDIRTAEPIRLSWKGLLKGVFIGLFLGLVLRVGGTLTVYFVLVFALFVGFTSKRVEAVSNPNQGIRVAIYNGILAFIIAGTVLGLNSAYTYDWSFFAGSTGFINAGFVAGYAMGLGSAGKHFTLRLLLRWSQQMPWDLEAFLDKSVRLVLLHRVGGGYMFIHRLLLEHFAARV